RQTPRPLRLDVSRPRWLARRRPWCAARGTGRGQRGVEVCAPLGSGATGTHRPLGALVKHLFVTQDFGPDLGGMSRRHVELCRRVAPDDVVVSTVAATDGGAFDAD